MPATARSYVSRRDLARRMRWLFASKRGAATCDLDVVLVDHEEAQVVIPVHRCILAAGSEALRVMIELQLQMQHSPLA